MLSREGDVYNFDEFAQQLKHLQEFRVTGEKEADEINDVAHRE